MLIPREVIEEIIYRSDIEQIIGSYVQLKKSGSGYVGLCPFHSEKTPSFSVNTKEKFFYCFGCGAGGDVITFIMRAENLDYVGAVEFLAERAGINIDTGRNRADGEYGIPRKRILEMNLEAAKYFRSNLYDPHIGTEAMHYLAEERKLPQSIIRHFGLGYSPASFGALTDHMHKTGYTDEELKVGFLAATSAKTGRPYDYFRNRVIFPIIDTKGDIVAFGGRVMDDSKPKSLNTSDTPAFKKSKNLFALNYAKNHCAEEMILCEGYMDVIALHSAGFENAVATLGTAITPEHARIMSKYTKKVIISYDSDQAGQTAADKAMKLLGEVGLDVRVLQIKDAKDPDEYIRKYGSDRFRQMLSGSKTGFEYKMNQILAKYDTSVPDELIKASGALCSLVAGTASGVEREVYISIISDKLGLSKDSLKNDVERIRNSMRREHMRKEGQQAQMSAMNIGDRVNPDAAKDVQAASAEEAILGMMLIYPEYRKNVLNKAIKLDAENFVTEFGRRVFEAIMKLEATENGFSLSLLGESFNPDEMGRITSMECKRRDMTRNDSEVFNSTVDSLKKLKAQKDDSDWLGQIKSRQDELKKKRRS